MLNKINILWYINGKKDGKEREEQKKTDFFEHILTKLWIIALFKRHEREKPIANGR